MGGGASMERRRGSEWGLKTVSDQADRRFVDRELADFAGRGFEDLSILNRQFAGVIQSTIQRSKASKPSFLTFGIS